MKSLIRWTIGMTCMAFVSVAWGQGATNGPTKGTSVKVPGQSKEYLVRRGDTLWDISNRFLGSPWFWPKLWSKNPHIQNPHWIFPGNKLRINSTGQVVAKTRKATIPKGRTGVSFGRGGLHWGNKMLLTRRDSFIDKEGLKQSGKILQASEGQALISKDDFVYIKFRNLRNVTVGEKYSIFRVVSKIKDPTSKPNRELGYMIRLHGVVEIVERKKKFAVGRVSASFKEIEKNYFVGPYTKNKVKVQIRRNEALVKGSVLRATSNVTMYGQFYQVFVNRGRRHGIRVGNTFDIYRYRTNDDGAIGQKKAKSVKIRERIGAAVVIDVRLNSSVAVVVRSLMEIQDGDLAETSLIN